MATTQQGTGAKPQSHSEEPELTNEESVPVDRKDTEGEKMMEDLGRERRRQDENK